MYARIGTFKTSSAQIDAVIQDLRVNAVKAFSAHKGFLGYQAYVDKETGCIIGISRWNSRQALELTDESAKNILRMASELGAHVIGDPKILEEAFDEKPLALIAEGNN
tara:strand:- start:2489 stop:2812 length:324 start_codon:yes stop_codon:yes gene_type:complete